MSSFFKCSQIIVNVDLKKKNVSFQFEPPLRGIHITDDLASLSTVPMIYPVNEPLLSDWPSSMTAKIYRYVSLDNIIPYVLTMVFNFFFHIMR